ncbi:hypothetical protein B0A48_02088 [Cryoendolithus antarcticus]|uniref:Enoyl reductase (ER) domain-containing protein n=1 Tax=Cryoendolithus antarcticus TaxID=1507870 RepID=A0A1V8TMN5_9PEZI|nr:hypothetical protein B0A48_02088 [Cryoendolithus antarcticus]
MRALRFHGKGDVRLDDIPIPQCGPREVRLKVAYCGICGTDVHEYLDGPILLPSHDEPNKFTGAGLPLTMGHEMSGIVTEVGGDVKSVTVGQRVCVNPATGCEHQGRPDCGFADEICVDAIAIKPLADHVSLKLGAMAEPLAVASHMVRVSGFQKGQNVVVLGAGPIGCALTLLLKEVGAKCILVSEMAESRTVQAKACGATRVVHPMRDDVLAVTLDMMAPGADVVFDACGIQSTLNTALDCTKPGGTIFNVAIHEKPLQIDMNRITLSEKRILAGNAYTNDDFDTVVRLLERRGPEIESFITAVVPLEQAVSGGFEELVHHKARHSKILIEVGGELRERVSSSL